MHWKNAGNIEWNSPFCFFSRNYQQNMSSSSYVDYLNYVSIELSNYLGLSTFSIGFIGGICSTIVFLSLKIFRDSPSGVYLIVLSIVNIIALIVGYLYRTLVVGSLVSWLNVSILSCTVRLYAIQVCGNISSSCLCLAVMDQYFATGKSVRFQQLSHRKVTIRICLVMCLFWILLCIPTLIYYRPIAGSSPNTLVCAITNVNFSHYMSRVYTPVISVGIVFSLLITFAILAYRNVQQISHRTVPLVRRQHEIQMTSMILVQACLTVTTALPYFILFIIMNNTILTTDPVTMAKIQLVLGITIWLNNASFAVNLILLLFSC